MRLCKPLTLPQEILHRVLLPARPLYRRRLVHLS